MKLFISADIEGVTGVTSWSETTLGKSDATPFIKQMEKEVSAVIESAYEKGFTEVVIKDAHDTGRNLDINLFPEHVNVIRGWSGHPLSMIEGIDNSFDAIAFIGYHSAASKGTSPLSHTLHVSKLNSIIINGELASEFLIFYYAGLYLGIPTVFVSGDKGLCEEVNRVNDNIITVSTKEGMGKATINENPKKVLNNVKDAFGGLVFSKDRFMGKLPEFFDVEISFKNPSLAYWAGFYPGAEQINDTTIKYNTKNYMDVLTLFSFLVKE
ncbi:D-amino peptidase [Natranaerovirga pectinivora]|uniref:D-amino peptidase n=1 Tax=Natranaerovirga pectinivora TaxID=682400 RepID=A0A4R3MN32_9FIRM|nr:M55 family metallopeptidase [Natranaerovirga pectinivora]TCT15434.1 D-amino peptidase [Natranaerovirga pectinivora]